MLFGIRDQKGKLHDVTPDGPSNVTLPAGGVNGLVGQPKPVTTESGFAPGAVLHGYTTPAMEGSIKLMVEPPFTYGQVARWFSPNKDAHIILGSWELAVRLRAMVAHPDVAPDEEPLIEMEIPLASFDGVWLSAPRRGARVTNDGDVAIYPTIEWQGANSLVQWPSGFVTDLPPVTEKSTLDTSDDGGFTVRSNGRVDSVASGKVAGFSEPVPPGATASLTLSNCDAIWRVGRWSPWE